MNERTNTDKAVQWHDAEVTVANIRVTNHGKTGRWPLRFTQPIFLQAHAAFKSHDGKQWMKANTNEHDALKHNAENGYIKNKMRSNV